MHVGIQEIVDYRERYLQEIGDHRETFYRDLLI